MKKTFKSFGIITLFVVAMMAVACTSEPNNANKLLGTWECTANEAIAPSMEWGEEASGSLVGKSVTFSLDGTYKATSPKLVDNASTGYWSISDTSSRLYINSTKYWKIKGLSATELKIETYMVDNILTYDTAGSYIVNGPFTRTFKKK